MKYLHLISGPRNISTALMYSFAQRSDTLVVDEPFYAVYLDRTGVIHPGREAVLASQSVSEAAVLREVFRERERPVLFIKNMAHHIEVLGRDFLRDVVNIFLIRDPRQIIASYSRVIERPVLRDLGIRFQYELFGALQSAGIHPVVIDSAAILRDPAAALSRLCAETGLDFEPSMLHWPAGPRPYDGVWAPHWYANVHASTGFDAPQGKTAPLPPELLPLYDEALPYYEELAAHSIQV